METLKIIVCGDGGVGKSSLLDRFVFNKFEINSPLTKGVEFFSKKIKLNTASKEYSAVFWDFGGQMQFRFMLPNFISGAVGAILAFDLTRFNSIVRIDEWLNELNSKGNFPILLVGTKYDLDDLVILSLDEYAEQIVENYDRVIDFIKTSAKSSHNVKETFDILIDCLLKNGNTKNSENNPAEKYLA